MKRNVIVAIVVVVVVIAAVAAAFALNSLQSPSTPSSSPSPSTTSSPTTTNSLTPSSSAVNPSISPSATNTPGTTPQPTTPTSTQTPAATILPTSTPSATSPATTPITTGTPGPTASPTTAPTPTPISTTPPSGVTATFDFDTGTPTLAVHFGTPLDQTSNGVTAHISSPSDIGASAFKVESHSSLLPGVSVTLNLFSANFLYPNTVNHDRLDIKFSQNVNSVTLTFATIEYHDPGPQGTGSTIRLSAYLNSVTSSPIKSVTANGIEDQGSSYPESTITLTSTGQPFNLIEIDLPNAAQGATGFIIDNVIAITA